MTHVMSKTETAIAREHLGKIAMKMADEMTFEELRASIDNVVINETWLLLDDPKRELRYVAINIALHKLLDNFADRYGIASKRRYPK